MKSTDVKRGINLTILLLLFFFVRSYSQICSGFSINNINGSCTVTVTFKVFDGNTCTNTGVGTVTIGAFSSYSIPATFISGVEDIEIIVLSVTGAIPVNYGSGTSGGGAWSCYNAGNPATMSDSASDPCFVSYSILVTCSNATIW